MEWLIGAVALIAIILAAVAAIKSLIVIVPPNRVAVISGRNRALTDGRTVGYRVIKGGRTLRVPLLEKVDFMDLNTIPIEVSVTNAYSKGAIPLDVQGVANIKVSSREGVLENSVERFLGRESSYIQQIAKENLEANLRGVLSTLTPEEVNEDRLKFAQTLIDEADDDIKTLGLELDVLKIQNVTDQVGYLEAVGRRQTALVMKEARESEAMREAEAEEAEATGRERSELARVAADLHIVEEENKLRVRRALLDAEAVAREAEAVVSGERAKAVAEQELEQERIELQKRRLQADVIEPAEARKQAMELEAKGRAAKIIEDGNAQVEVFKLLTSQYQEAGDDAQEIFVLNMLPELVAQIVDTVKGVNIDKISVIDSGQGGSGQGIPGVMSQLPASVISITEQIENATGVNILDALSKRTDGIVDAKSIDKTERKVTEQPDPA
ncbi:MAG: flotillin family protein [Acidimicrobiia bacterium]|nr:flotillin family protein [Acidimicrobiia bacterium]NNL29082.1 flotillin family protein [Acidimicrobiia bacterium]